MHTIYFVRHGQSFTNAGGITQPNTDIQLTELGHEQARLVASMLPANTPLILASEFIRTEQTAQYLAQKANLAIKREPLLNEFSMLCHEATSGLNGEQRKPIFDRYWENSDPNYIGGLTAESFVQFASRVKIFRLNKLKQLPNNTVIFGHSIC